MRLNRIQNCLSNLLLTNYFVHLSGKKVDEDEQPNGYNRSAFNFDYPLPFSNSSFQPETSVGDFHPRAKRSVNSLTDNKIFHVFILTIQY